jgi:hypothetical protein
MRYEIILDTSDYLTLPTGVASVTLTPQRIQIILSLAVISLERNAWEAMSDSAWDAWVAGLTEMIEQLQDY